MKYVKKIPPTNIDSKTSLLINEGWEQIKEPTNLLVASINSIPFIIFGGLICYFIIIQFNTLFAKLFKNYTESF